MDISNLLKQSESLRDETWERAFLALLPELHFSLLDGQPQQGPDGWPYLFVEIQQVADQSGSTEADAEANAGEPFLEMLQWLLNEGVGLAINPERMPPDYVLPYGQLWLFQTTGKFISEQAPSFKGGETFTIAKGEKIVAGPPTEEYFPTYARRVVNEFLSQQGVESPRVLVLSSDNKSYDLCFSTESFGNPPEQEHVGILEALSWFFPANYSLALVSEKGLPKFSPLA